MTWYGRQIAEILSTVQNIDAKVDKIMSDQATEAALAADIETDVAKENTALDGIKTEIANLQAANPSVDFTALQAAVAGQDTAVAAEQAVAASPAP